VSMKSSIEKGLSVGVEYIELSMITLTIIFILLIIYQIMTQDIYYYPSTLL
jgi:hypothetical protein